MNASLPVLQKMIDESGRIVFFGGAGVSTESGIPDFRSADGLYRGDCDVPPEIILSHTFFVSRTEEFFRFYRDRMLYPGAKPNAAHRKLAELERSGKLSCVVTQNIDGLHQAAGSRKVHELHGSVHRNHCMRCGAFYDSGWILSTRGVPRCEKCGGVVKPDVVLYEEGLDGKTLSDSIAAIEASDMLIIAGTSLSVYPAASLVRYFRGNRLVLINRDPTPLDGKTALTLHGRVGEILGSVAVR